MAAFRRTTRGNRNRARVQAMARVPETRGFGEAPRGTSRLVFSGQDAVAPPAVLGKPGFLGIDFGEIIDDIGDFLGDSFVGLFEDTPPPRATGGGGGGAPRPAAGRDLVFTDTRGGGGRRQPPPEAVSSLDTFTGGDAGNGGGNVFDEVSSILEDLGLPSFGFGGTAAVARSGPIDETSVTGAFFDLDANQLEDSAGRQLVVNPGVEQRIKCPRGYVAVEIDEEGTRVCMLKGAAISQGLYSRRPRPPISASEWRILKSSGRTAKKVEVVLGKAGAAVGKKLISKSARASRPRARQAALPVARTLALPAASDDDTVIIT